MISSCNVTKFIESNRKLEEVVLAYIFNIWNFDLFIHTVRGNELDATEISLLRRKIYHNRLNFEHVGQ